MITLQKTNQFGVLKAIGASSRSLAVDLAAQVLLLTLLGAAVGAGLANVIAAALPAEVPFALSNRLILVYSGVLLAVAVVGVGLSMARIARIDPRSRSDGWTEMARLLIDNVVKVYGAGEQAVTALAGVSLQVAAGEFVAIVGPSGSGKTTLLAVAGALLQPSSGSVAIDGQALAGLSAGAMARLRVQKLGFVLQSSNLVPFLRARDQLLYVGKIAGVPYRDAKARADALLAALGIANRGHHYPEALSGGERQRVAIARALMNDPAVLLCDEPTASLDSQRGRQVVEMLAHEIRSRGKAGVMVTHDERMLDFVDRVYRIADGVMREEPVGALRS